MLNKVKRECQTSYLFLSHLALQVGSSNWICKTQIHSIKRWRHFGAKTSQSAFLFEKRLLPLLYWIRHSWSRLTHILCYINLSVRWNTSLRNQISSCQQVFYYNSFIEYVPEEHLQHVINILIFERQNNNWS